MRLTLRKKKRFIKKQWFAWFPVCLEAHGPEPKIWVWWEWVDREVGMNACWGTNMYCYHPLNLTGEDHE